MSDLPTKIELKALKDEFYQKVHVQLKSHLERKVGDAMRTAASKGESVVRFVFTDESHPSYQSANSPYSANYSGNLIEMPHYKDEAVYQYLFTRLSTVYDSVTEVFVYKGDTPYKVIVVENVL